MKKIIILIILILAVIGFIFIKNNNQENITSFLEKNLGSKSNENGKVFCSYEILGKEKNNFYLRVNCDEFFINNKKLVCPTKEALTACFEKDCTSCFKKEINPMLTQGDSLSEPIRLTKKNGTFEMWPALGEVCTKKDIEREFPKKIASKVFDTSIEELESLNIKKAENYFKVKATFEVAEVFDSVCEKDSDCGIVPGKYAIISRCPHQMKCMNHKCAVGCYDFTNYENIPVLERE